MGYLRKPILQCGNLQGPYFEFGLHLWSQVLTAAVLNIPEIACQSKSIFLLDFLLKKVELLYLVLLVFSVMVTATAHTSSLVPFLFCLNKPQMENTLLPRHFPP